MAFCWYNKVVPVIRYLEIVSRTKSHDQNAFLEPNTAIKIIRFDCNYDRESAQEAKTTRLQNITISLKLHEKLRRKNNVIALFSDEQPL